MSTLLDKASIIIPRGAASKASVLYASSNDGKTLIPITTVQNTANLTRINEAGERVTVLSNVLPRDFENGGCGDLAIWPQRTNRFLNSETLATQDVTATAVVHTVSFSGTGTITFSGAHTGSLVGSGAGDNDIVSVSFTPSAGTVTCTISGTVKYANFEIGTYRSAWIPTVASVETRDAMIPILTGAGSRIGNENGIYMEYLAFSNAESPTISLGEDAAGFTNRLAVRLAQSGNKVSLFMTVGGVGQAVIDTPSSTSFPNVWNKIAIRQATNDVAIYLNGVSAGTDTSAIPFSGQLTAFRFASSNDVSRFYGRFRELVIFNQPPTNAELEAISTT